MHTIETGPLAPAVEVRAAAAAAAPSASLLGALAMLEPAKVIDILTASKEPDSVLSEMAQVTPGAVEALFFFEGAPRWLKRAATVALEDAGFMILS